MFASLLLAVMLALSFDDDRPQAVTLIGRLGSESFDDRVAAIKSLEHLGGAALPALQAARGSGDMRVQSRVNDLIESITHQVDADRFARPTMIQFDIRTRPFGELLSALNARYGLGLSLRIGPARRRGMRLVDPGEGDPLKELRSREVRPRAARPLPYWDAIDRLCEAGGVRYRVASVTFGAVRSALVLMPDRTDRGPVSDSGPFRVQITWPLPVFDGEFADLRGPAGARARLPGPSGITVPLAIMAEPGLMLRENGAVVVTEATDDRGRSLLFSAGQPLIRQGAVGRVRGENDAIELPVALAVPEPGATAIRRLRGKVPVIAITESADPMVIPLRGDGVPGRPYSTRDLTLIVESDSVALGAPSSVKVTVRGREGNRASFARHDPPEFPFAGFNFGGVLAHLELRDAAGRRLNYRLGSQTRRTDGDQYELIAARPSENDLAAPPADSSPPVPFELRYYRFVEKALEIPFDFRDVPMP